MNPIFVMRLKRLRRDDAGASLLEFSLALPVLIFLGGYGIELANYFLYNMRISQYALDLADNASRVDQSGAVTIAAAAQLRKLA